MKAKHQAPVKPKPQNRKCIYTGRRLNGGKVQQRFETCNGHPDDGEEMYYQGVRGVYIGYTYRCGVDSIKSRPECVQGAEVLHNSEWDRDDALVDARNKQKRAEKAMAGKASPALKQAIAVLEPLFRNLDLYSRKALIEYLVMRGVTRKKGSK